MKRKSLLMCLALVLSMAMAIGGTLAYLTDTAVTANVMTVGNVDILLTEWERLDLTGNENEENLTYAPGTSTAQQEKIQPFVNRVQPLYPAVVMDEADLTDGIMWSSNDIAGAVDKIVRVENVGTGDAYFRVVVAFEHLDEGMLHINWNTVDYDVKPSLEKVEMENGKIYDLYVATYKNALRAGTVSPASLLQVYLDSAATNETVAAMNGEYSILVAAQACQTTNFEAMAQAQGIDTVLNTAFDPITATVHPWSDGEVFEEDEEEKKQTVTSGFVTIEDGKAAELIADNVTVTVPAGAVNVDAVELVVIKNYDMPNITLAAGATAETYEIKLKNRSGDFVQLNAGSKLQVEWNIGTGLEDNNVQVYHYTNLIGANYANDTGILSFEIESLSPVTWVKNPAVVKDSAALADALSKTDSGDTIVLSNGSYTIDEAVKTNGQLLVPEGANVTLDLGGNKLSSEAEDNNPLVIIEANANVTIKNGTLKNDDPITGHTNVPAVKNEGGNLVLENCTIQNSAPTSGGAYALVATSGTTTLKNCTVKGNRGGISLSGDAKLIVEGGTVDATVYYPLYIENSFTGKATFDGTEFVKQSNKKGLAIIYNVVKENAGTVDFTNCKFTSKTSSAIPVEINKNHTGLTFIGCTYNNVNMTYQQGDTITLKSGEYTAEDLFGEETETKAQVVVPAGANVTLDMENKDLTSPEGGNAPLVVLEEGATMTIENGTLYNNDPIAENTNSPAVKNEGGNLVLKGMVIKNNAPTTGGAYALVVTSGTTTLENCTVEGNRGGISVSGDAKLIVTGGTVKATVYYPLYLQGNAKATFTDTTFVKENSSKGKAIIYNTFVDNAGTATFTNCTFEGKLSKTIPVEIGGNYTGLTFNDCTHTNVTDPAIN